MKTSEILNINDPWIREILGTFYRPEYIFAKHVEMKENDEIAVTFRFSPYKRTVSPLSHVSGNQIHEAVMEGTYLAIWIAIQQGRFWESISFEDFLKSRAIALYREAHLKFKKQIIFDTDVTLVFHIGESDIRDVRGKFSTATVQVSGFVEWSSKSCIGMREFINAILDKP